MSSRSQHRDLVDGRVAAGLHQASPFYATYRCADGRFLSVGAIEPQFYAVLLGKLGLQDDAAFRQQWNRDLWPALKARLQAIFGTRDRDAWAALFDGSDACVAPVLSAEEAARHPHNRARGTFFVRDGFLQAAPAPRFDGDACEPGPIPRHGEHTEAVVAGLRRGSQDGPWRPSA